jgi:hypothetical protein
MKKQESPPRHCRQSAGFSSLAMFVMLAFGCQGSAGAATFCAHNVTEIQAALTAAQANGEDDTVNVVSGNYPLTTTLTFDSSEAHTIAIAGSFDDAQCAQDSLDLAGDGTVLDGQHTVRALFIANPNGGVILQALTVIAGSATNGSAGAGATIAGCAGCVIDYNTFFGNRVSGTNAQAGALLINGSVSLEFADNLFFGNRGTKIGGVVLNFGNGTGVIKNNTITANITDTLSDPGGLLLKGGMQYQMSNNIVWGNIAPGGSDFGVTSANTRIANDIGVVMTGSTAGTVSAELSVDPMFADCGFLCFGFELGGGSPLINAGNDSPGGIPFTAFDLAGKARYVGAHIDIGAFESSDPIFDDDFEQ